MSKSLYLVRHGKSDWSIPGRKDFDRDLNAKGINDAPKMGRKLRQLDVQLDLVLSSPAVRAKATAEFISEQLGYNFDRIDFNEEIYEASLRTMLGILNNLDDSIGNVMLFGHNPGLTYLAEYLTKEDLGDIPTCGVVAMEFTVASWKEISGGLGELKWFLTPRKDLTEADEKSEADEV